MIWSTGLFVDLLLERVQGVVEEVEKCDTYIKLGGPSGKCHGMIAISRERNHAERKSYSKDAGELQS